MKYANLLPILLKKNLAQTRPPPQVPDVLPIWYRPDLFCAFHQGAPGHDTEHCHPLKEEVQKLLENNAWSFDDPDLKVLGQQQHPASHSLAIAVQHSGYQPQFQQGQQQHPASHSLAVAVQNSGYQPQSQQGQQQYLSSRSVNMMPIMNAVRNPGYQPSLNNFNNKLFNSSIRKSRLQEQNLIQFP